MNMEDIITHRFFSDITTEESQRPICLELDPQINLTAGKLRHNMIQGNQRVHCLYKLLYKSSQSSPSVYYKCPAPNPHAVHTHTHTPTHKC